MTTSTPRAHDYAASPWVGRLPYLLGLVLAGSLLLFSFDVFDAGVTVDSLIGFVLHSLPTIAILGALGIARLDEKLGAATFALLAVASAVVFEDPVGLIITTVPMLLIGGLLYWHARR